MRIVHGIHSLAGSNGVQTYIATVGDVHQRNGHEVWCYAEAAGEGDELLLSLGLRVAHRIDELPEEIDVYFAHDTAASLEMHDNRPGVAQIFVWHGNYFDGNVTPQINGAVTSIVALTPSAERRIAGLAVKPPVTMLTQPIDLTRFRSQRPIADRPRVAVALSNYLSGEHLSILRTACEIAGIELRLVGAHGDYVTRRPQDAINDADIVFGKGRAATEAMACGRAVYVYDVFGADGWVTPETYADLAYVNFSGTARAEKLDAERLAADLGRYSPSMGPENQALAIKHHHGITHATKLIELAEIAIRDSGATVRHSDAYELHRTARVSWRHEAEAFQLKSRMSALSLELGDARWELEKSAAEVERLESELAALKGSASWRVTAPLRAIKRLGK